VAARTNGFDFEFPLDKEKTRYLRFVFKNNWANTNFLVIAEFSFYGDDGSGE
jgi:hypothetical protein